MQQPEVRVYILTSYTAIAPELLHPGTLESVNCYAGCERQTSKLMLVWIKLKELKIKYVEPKRLQRDG